MKAINSNLHRCVAPLFVAVLLSACTTPQQGTNDSSVRQRTDLEHRSLASAFERLGHETAYDIVSRASDLGGEFYTAINARFPPSAPASRGILIREVRWQRGNHWIAAFSTRQEGTWIVFDAVEWHKDAVF
jgi:hypothetical protein